MRTAADEAVESGQTSLRAQSRQLQIHRRSHLHMFSNVVSSRNGLSGHFLPLVPKLIGVDFNLR